jgi:diguanylate cyclase (GGDEF)-like protein
VNCEVEKPRRLGPWSRVGLPSAAAAAIIGIGLADYVTTFELALSLLYLLPILAVAWWSHRGTALGVAFLGLGIAFVTDLASREGHSLSIVAWDAVTRAFVFIGASELTAVVGAERRRLRAVVDCLKRMLEREAALARMDPLTGLPNSRAFREALGRTLERASRDGEKTVVAYLDVDNFKHVNDRHGHGAGDDLLKRFGELLRTSLRPGDVAGRLGGDEFGVIFAGVSPEDVVQLAKQLVARVAELGKDYPGCELGVSVGIAAPSGVPDGERVLQLADAAMYEAKAFGKGRVVLREVPVAGAKVAG